VAAVYANQALWRNPAARDDTRSIFVLGFDPAERVFDLPEVRERQHELRMPDVALYDAASRPEFGPVAEWFRARGPLETEIGGRNVRVIGLYELGTSFGIDASIVTSDLNFQRIFPQHPPGLIQIGLVRLEPGTAPEAARDAIAAALPGDVEVLTRADFRRREIHYWDTATPIGYVFAFGVIVGLVVGSIIVYQILFADVSDHLKEYATLKAMGYTNGYLFRVVLQEAVILAVLGYVPGLLVVLALYRLAGDATSLPLEMTLARGVAVLALTAGMCCLSGAIALRKLRNADPADVF
jgi:putative ABC transport system permease protein